ncbi:hypothetical protein FKG94_06475 [Exilibacterium tricleocarpae]|uniref:Uncharacterized protein n=1 Tax=Exilibacterium tricleocarpae TaxID=2591008 RepID=A0A545U483_9GAMM|nr:hypothetical protein [Exilibacterium tricleocarpae]TQV84297.1 hypothetical protein FKG94_06475 [Exilibacterium tricleocarpae]
MEAILSFIEKHFRHPMVPLFFMLGAALSLLGITSGLPIEGYKELVTTNDFRYLSVALGVICIAIAIFIYYNPPGAPAAGEGGPAANPAGDINSPIALPSELLLPWPARRDYLTQYQRRLLTYLEESGDIRFSAILEAFPERASEELFYRLEQLRLLGFIVYEQIGAKKADPDAHCYRLSEAYAAEVREMLSGMTVRATKK